MRIAFDLDGTLIRLETDFPLEKYRFPILARLFSTEKLRLGTIPLIKGLQQEGHEIWVYTSSFRSPFYIRRMFWLHGIRLQGIVNQEIHNKTVRKSNTKLKSGSTFRFPSKYPPLFGIDILIEDSEGVKLEGDEFGFNVLIVKGNETSWIDRLKAQMDSYIQL